MEISYEIMLCSFCRPFGWVEMSFTQNFYCYWVKLGTTEKGTGSLRLLNNSAAAASRDRWDSPRIPQGAGCCSSVLMPWTLRTGPPEWQTGIVVPFLKKGNQRLCSSHTGIPLLCLSGKIYSSLLGCLTKQSTHVLWIWRRLSTVFLKVSYGAALGMWGR